MFALKNGFSLGRAHITNKSSGAVLPAVVVGILILATCTTLLKASQAGPGSMHAPIIASLVGGLVFGAFAQKSRMCFAGSIRDIILMKNFDLISVIAGLFVVMLVFNIATGRFVLGFQYTWSHRTFGTFVEYPWNVHCGICSSSCRWMPASSADPCRAGFFGFGCNRCRNVCRICNLP